MTSLAENPAVLDPRGALTPRQRAVLRNIDTLRWHRRVRGGWLVGKTRHRTETLRTLLDLNLIREGFVDGRATLVVTGTGRVVLDQLDGIQAPDEEETTTPLEGVRRDPYWLND